MAQISTKRIKSAQEHELAELQKKRKSLLKKITAERTRLETLKADLKVFIRKSSSEIMNQMMELQAAKEKFRTILQRCSESKKFTRAERNQFLEMNDDLEDMFSELLPHEFRVEEAREMFRKKVEEQGFDFADMFDNHKTPIAKEEGKQIRDVYKRLAAEFHPDKSAGNAKLEEKLHALMQRINLAYKRSDIAELLEIEASHSRSDFSLYETADMLEDFLEREIQKIQQEVELCTTQLSRLKTERKEIERSKEAKAYQDYRKVKLFGIDPFEEMKAGITESLNEMQESIGLYEQFLNGAISRRTFNREFEKLAAQQEAEFFDDFTQEDIMDALQDYLATMEQSRGSKTNRQGRAAPQPSKQGRSPNSKKR